MAKSLQVIFQIKMPFHLGTRLDSFVSSLTYITLHHRFINEMGSILKELEMGKNMALKLVAFAKKSSREIRCQY